MADFGNIRSLIHFTRDSSSGITVSSQSAVDETTGDTVATGLTYKNHTSSTGGTNFTSYVGSTNDGLYADQLLAGTVGGTTYPGFTLNRSTGTYPTQAGTNDFSVDFFFSPQYLPSSRQTVLRMYGQDSHYLGSGYVELTYENSSSSHLFRLRQGFNSNSLILQHFNFTISATALTSLSTHSSWIHVRLYRLSGVFYLYFDGALKDSWTPGNGSYNFNSSMNVGAGLYEEFLLRIGSSAYPLNDINWNPTTVRTIPYVAYDVGTMSNSVQNAISINTINFKNADPNDFAVTTTINSIGGNAIIADPNNFASTITQTSTARNIVGFPDLDYVVDNYVADSYVGITFDAAMNQSFSARSVFDTLGGLARFGTSSISASSAINNETGLIFDESMSATASSIFASTGGRLQTTTYNFAADAQFNALGGNAIVAVISVTSDSQASGTATVEIIPDANIIADTAINTVAGYLQTSGTLTLGADAQYVVDQTAGTTAGILFSGQASIATDMTAVLQGGLNFVVSTSLDIETATNVVGGYLKTFASSIAADAQTTIIPTLLKQTAQAQITSSHQTNFLLNVNFTAKDTNINTSTQTSASGRILQAVDPFRAIDIASELRKIIVQAELRDDQINSESRINKINQETRKETMLSETRKAEIYNDKTIVQRSNRRVGDRI